MSATGNQPLARAIYTLQDAAGGLEAPDDVIALAHAIDASLFADKPRKSLNKRVANLRRNRPRFPIELSRWLKSPEVKARMRQKGAYWSWLVWRRAAWLLYRNKPAHAAFGMDKGGRPKSPGFTRADDAAIYAVHLWESAQSPTARESLKHAATVYGALLKEVKKSIRMARSIGREGRKAAIEHSAFKRR